MEDRTKVNNMGTKLFVLDNFFVIGVLVFSQI